MSVHILTIKSLAVQNVIMGAALCLVLALLLRGLLARDRRHILLAVIWSGLVVWFFNGPFWGFSRVVCTGDSLRIEYGFLSFFKNETLHGSPDWRVESEWQGFPRYRELYTLCIGKHCSQNMERENRSLLKRLSACIETMEAGSPDGGGGGD